MDPPEVPLGDDPKDLTVGFVDAICERNGASDLDLIDLHQHTHVMGMMFFSNLELNKL